MGGKAACSNQSCRTPCSGQLDGVAILECPDNHHRVKQLQLSPSKDYAEQRHEFEDLKRPCNHKDGAGTKCRKPMTLVKPVESRRRLTHRRLGVQRLERLLETIKSAHNK